VLDPAANVNKIMLHPADAARAPIRATVILPEPGQPNPSQLTAARTGARRAPAGSDMFLLTFLSGSSTKRQQKRVGSSRPCWIQHDSVDVFGWIQQQPSTKTCLIQQTQRVHRSVQQ
jgi:hypothetical protein